MATPTSPTTPDPLLKFQEQVVQLQKQGKDLSKYEVEKTKSGVFVLKEIPRDPGLFARLFRGSDAAHTQNIQAIAKKSQELLSTPKNGVDSVVMTRALTALLKKQVTIRQNPSEDGDISDAFASVSSLNRVASNVNPVHRAITTLEQAVADLQSNSQPLVKVMKQVSTIFKDFSPSELDRIHGTPEFVQLKTVLLELAKTKASMPDAEQERVTIAIKQTSIPAPTTVPLEFEDSTDAQYNKTKKLMDKWFSKIPNFKAVKQTFAREGLENFSIGRSITPELRVLQHLKQIGADQDFIQQAKIALLAEALSQEMMLRWPRASRADIDREVANLISLCPVDKNPIADLSVEFNNAGSRLGALGEGAVMKPVAASEQPTPRFIFRFHEDEEPGCTLDVRWKFKMFPNMLEEETSHPVLMHSSLSKAMHERVYRGFAAIEREPPPRP